MGLFEPVQLTIELNSLEIKIAEDRLGDVEPYVIPVFFKVDGERYVATLRIGNSRQSDGGGEEAFVQFSVETIENGPLEVGEAPVFKPNYANVWVPPGNLLDRGGFSSGEMVDLADINYRATLNPIPFRIDVLGLPDLSLDALQGLILELSGEVLTVINTVFVAFDLFLQNVLGLDEEIEACPAVDANSGKFLNNIEAQFNSLLPGTFGAVFVCMENDAWDEDTAQELRSSIRNEIASIINNTVNDIRLNNPIPDPDLFSDPERIETDIVSEVTWPVLADMGASFGSLVVSHLSGSTLFGVHGLLTSISWAVGGLDEVMGQVLIAKSHLDADVWPRGAHVRFRAPIPDVDIPDDANEWVLHGTVTFH
jgi:hypothetical protein